MIGQTKLLNRFNNYTRFSMLPNVTIICGEDGCGKNTFIKYLSDKYSVKINDISDKISLDTLSDIYVGVEETFVVINFSIVKNLEKAQNILLKFLEEPPIHCKIIILTVLQSSLLDTVQNRGHVLYFDSYTEAQLLDYASSIDCEITKEALEIYNTPGKIKMYKNDPTAYDDTMSLCHKIISKVRLATVPNVLTIADKMTTDGSILLFGVIMRNLCLKELVSATIPLSEFMNIKNIYDKTCSLCFKLSTSNINKNYLLQNYLISLKTI